MVAYEQRIYDYIVKNVPLISDGSVLPFSELPDALMYKLRLLASKEPDEEIYTVIFNPGSV